MLRSVALAALPRRAIRSLSTSCSRGLATLPSHTFITMPALSPTMTQGNIASWKVKAGDAIKPGSVVAEIETDKATVDLEVQEDGIIGKLLMESGAKDIVCGTPIAVLVESKDDVAAFADFKAPETKPPKPAAAAEASKPKQATAAEPSQAPPREPVKRDDAAAKDDAKGKSAPSEPRLAASSAPSLAPRKPATPLAASSSPLETLLAAERAAYETKYGNTLLVAVSEAAAKKPDGKQGAGDAAQKDGRAR